MFARRNPVEGEIEVGNMSMLRGGQEFARLWADASGGITCIIEPRALGSDPAMFGIAAVDAVRHAAKAYAQALGAPEAEVLARIWQGFEAERGHPTDTPQQISPGIEH